MRPLREAIAVDRVLVLGAVIWGLQGQACAWAGPFVDNAISAGSPLIRRWATSVKSVTRGPLDIASPTGGLASYGVAGNALGPADCTNGTGGVVSLGDGGSITLGFDFSIANGVGPDFAVFENGFGVGDNVFAELAFVEVSSDGTNFFRFPSVDLTPTDAQVGAFDSIDPTDLHDLAGKDPAMTGTAFDLQELAGISPLLNVNRVMYVRLTDVVGRIDSAGGYGPTTDSLGNVINDPYPTPFSTCGFDLDAVGVLQLGIVPEPGGFVCAGVLMGVRGLRRRRPVVVAL